MYYGKMTRELQTLYAQYHSIWGNDPDCYENAEYGENEYKQYVADIKKAIELKVELPALYPYDEDEF